MFFIIKKKYNFFYENEYTILQYLPLTCIALPNGKNPTIKANPYRVVSA
jgi:hypothetical protein